MRGVLGQALGEPERDLALGRLDGVGAVDDVAADAVFFFKNLSNGLKQELSFLKKLKRVLSINTQKSLTRLQVLN